MNSQKFPDTIGVVVVPLFELVRQELVRLDEFKTIEGLWFSPEVPRGIKIWEDYEKSLPVEETFCFKWEALILELLGSYQEDGNPGPRPGYVVKRFTALVEAACRRACTLLTGDPRNEETGVYGGDKGYRSTSAASYRARRRILAAARRKGL